MITNNSIPAHLDGNKIIDEFIEYADIPEIIDQIEEFYIGLFGSEEFVLTESKYRKDRAFQLHVLMDLFRKAQNRKQMLERQVESYSM